MMVLWAQQKTTPLSTVCITCGSIQVVLLFFAFVASLYGRSSAKAGSSASAYDKYMADMAKSNNSFPVAGLAPARIDSTRLESNRMSTSSKASGQAGIGIAVANPGYVHNAQVFNVDDKI
jgi:hypothetical protein